MSAFSLPIISMRYPGRGIIIGMDVSGKHGVVVYIITGRSPASRARRLEREDDIVWTRPTDVETMKKGNTELLVYPALIVKKEGIAVSNGRQTPDIAGSSLPGTDPVELLSRALQAWEFEPDAPIFTPRINGFITVDGRAALSIIRRRDDGQAEKEAFPLALDRGKGFFISTYQGGEEDPLRSFQGAPWEVSLAEGNAVLTAESIYRSLSPPPGEKDYRVAVASLYFKTGETRPFDLHIINRQERRIREDGKE